MKNTPPVGLGDVTRASTQENFHVLTWLVPKPLRPDFMNLYWFCRTADDLADNHDGSEPARARAESLLREFRDQLHAAVAAPDNPEPASGTASAAPGARAPGLGFPALARTIRAHTLPLDQFDALIEAFIQDQSTTRYNQWDELVRYSAGSANPVGRLVLRILHTHSPIDLAAGDPLSDSICTALQLANFWQDIRRDLVERDRVYLPAVDSGISAEDLRTHLDTANAEFCDRFGEAVLALTRRTQAMMDAGKPLIQLLPPPHRPLIRLFIAGGDSILAALRRAQGQTLWRRPTVSKPRRALLLLRESAYKLAGI